MSKKNRGKGKSYFGSFDWTINNLLHLVDSLCERWDYKRHDDGTLTNKIVKTDTYISLKKEKETARTILTEQLVVHTALLYNYKIQYWLFKKNMN